MSILVSTGLGLPSEDWEAVRRELSELLPRPTPMVVVDRIGEHAENRSSVRGGGLLPGVQIDRMMAAAQAARIAPPYVVVGHSLGGLYAEAFARLQPQCTAGLVLVDGDVPPDFTSSAGPRSGAGTTVAIAAGSVLSTMLRVSGLRAGGPALRRAMVWSGSIGATDPLTVARRNVLYTDPRTLNGMLDEHLGYRALAAAVAELARETPLPSTPVTVVAAARCGRPVRKRHASWVNAQLRRSASLGADLIVADDAAHLVMLDAPGVVAGAIAATLAQR